MKVAWKKLILCLAVPLGVGGLSAFVTRAGMEAFQMLNKPALTPPEWLFPVAWTLLYILMGLGSYLVLISERPDRAALTVYGLQLAFNFLWSVFFFGLGWYLFAFFWLILLWILIFATMQLFRRSSRTAGWLMLPYLLWVAFAGYLNLSICLLN